MDTLYQFPNNIYLIASVVNLLYIRYDTNISTHRGRYGNRNPDVAYSR